MATREETLTTTAGTDEAIREGYDALQSLGLDVTQVAPDALEAKGGSMLMTYLVGLWIPSSSMPVKVKYGVSDDGHVRTIAIHVKSFFPSLYLWKFKERANQVMDGLLQGLSLRLPQSPTSA